MYPKFNSNEWGLQTIEFQVAGIYYALFQGYQGVQKQSPMTAVGVIFHAHELGKKMKLRHFTQTGQDTTENPWLGHVETYDSEKQKINLFQERRKITKVSITSLLQPSKHITSK